MSTRKKYFDLLYRALNLNPRRDVVSLAGGGGKTTSLMRLSRELHHDGKKVLVTSTTHLDRGNGLSEVVRFHGEITRDLVTEIESKLGRAPALVAKRQVRGAKLKGISAAQVASLNRHVSFDYMLVEADGSEKKPLKAHHRSEPDVPKCTTLFVVLIGFGVIGKKLNKENVHRPQNAARITGKKIDSLISPDDIIAMLRHPQGLLKGRPPATRTAVILNRVSAARQAEARKLAHAILGSCPDINSVICGEVSAPQQLLLFS